MLFRRPVPPQPAGLAAALVAACVVSLAQTAVHPSPFIFKKDQPVFLIVVKSKTLNDPSLWADISPSLASRRMVLNSPDQRREPQSGRSTLERTSPERTTLDRPAPELDIAADPDEAVKKRIEKMFLKKKKFRLADSLERADFVFFAKAEYLFVFQRTVPGGGSLTVAGKGDEQFNERFRGHNSYRLEMHPVRGCSQSGICQSSR